MKFAIFVFSSQILAKLICQKPRLGIGRGTPIIKDACCPNMESGIPYSSDTQGCCCGQLFDSATHYCCTPNNACDGTESLNLLDQNGAPLEPCTTRSCPDTSTVETIGQKFSCNLGNSINSNCKLNCQDGYELHTDDVNVSTNLTIAECNEITKMWHVNIPDNLCCVESCPPLPEGTMIDYMIILDKSSSIGDSNFEILKEFMKSMIDIMPLEQKGGRMSIVTYNSIVEQVFTLKDSLIYSKSELHSMVDDIIYRGRGTHTYKGIEHVINNDLADVNSYNRPDVRDIVLIVTDGNSRSSNRVQQSAQELRDRGVEVYAVGIANAIEREVVGMATEPKEKYTRMIQVFEELEDVAQSFLRDLCPAYTCQ